jgi:hypothetical protein
MLAKLKIENIVYFVADIDRTEAFSATSSASTCSAHPTKRTAIF